jgi:hypothetical protein
MEILLYVPVADFRKISRRNKPCAKDQVRSRPHRQAVEFGIRRSPIQGVIMSPIQGVIVLKTRAQVEGMPLVLARFLTLFARSAGSAGECLAPRGVYSP